MLLASCVSATPAVVARDDTIAARVEAVLARRGLGRDTLSVIDNVIRHDRMRPVAAAPVIVTDLLRQPLAAANAAALFDRAVPGPLRRLVDEAAAAPEGAPGGPPLALRDLLDPYLTELAGAQRVLRSAARPGALDAKAVVRELEGGLPSSDQLSAVAAGVDQARLEEATGRFLEATARFVGALRAGGARLQFPERALRFDSPVGVVSIGTRGNDVHGPDAAVIVDPGGDDTYERAPVTGGAISVIVDLGGDDRYRGSDVVVHGLSVLLDLSGDDTYAMRGPGLGAAIAGASLVLDLDGNDTYEAHVFGQGAAAFGLGAIVDLRGHDTYRLHAAGQGLGLPGGLGLLWDLSGDDTYVVAGLPDAFARGGGRSLAQGAASGVRTRLGGGVGILRDDRGDDTYAAEMLAQGVGYYHGLGLLWDRGGSDRYRAVRYAQGSGVHQAVGVLRDESGDDRYELAVGVGQGMGLDLAVGILLDGAGDDQYVARSLAQGTATANGLGVLFDGGGADRWQMGADGRAWGHAEWLRGLPSLGILVYDGTRAAFARDGVAVAPPPAATPIAHETAAPLACPPLAAGAARSVPSLAAALRAIAPGFYGGGVDAATYAEVQRRLTTNLRASLGEVSADDFDAVWSLGETLRCALGSASAHTAAEMWRAMDGLLAAEPASPFAGAIVGALRARPAPGPELRRMLRPLEDDPRCGVRAAALRLRDDAADDEVSRASAAAAARAALGSTCWRLQAAGLDVLGRAGAVPHAGVVLPSFLRRGPSVAN